MSEPDKKPTPPPPKDIKPVPPKPPRDRHERALGDKINPKGKATK